MPFPFWRLRRYAAYFLACLLSCTLVLGSIAPTSAQTTVTWEDLQAQSTNLRNPYEHLTTAQTYQLSNLYQLREWVSVNQPAPDSYERKEIQRLEDFFAAEGINADELLKEAEVARAYWAAQSRMTNADITEQLVLLDGYVLPLGAETAQGSDPQMQMTEFLLVPYVGACVHVPAPPPNQIVHIQTSEAVENPGVFSPVQVEGELQSHDGSYKVFQVDGSRTVDVSYQMNLKAITLTDTPPTAPSQTGQSLLTLEGWKQIPVRLSSTLTTALSQIQTQQSPGAMMFALLLSFSYGVLHTLGPGHGKAVIVSYFVGQGGSLRKGVKMGAQIAIFHVLSAILLVTLANTALRQFGVAAEDNYRVVQLVSYGAIALVGGWMLKQSLRGHTSAKTAQLHLTTSPLTQISNQTAKSLLYPSLNQQLQQTPQPALRQTTVYQTADQAQKNWKTCSCLACDEASSLSDWLALAVGAVPCSGALLVLLYGFANGIFWQSIVMVLAISAGMAMTLTWIGAMAILTHQRVARIAQQRLRKKKGLGMPVSLAQIGRIVGASCVCILGLSLFTATFLQQAG